MLEEDAEFE